MIPKDFDVVDKTWFSCNMLGVGCFFGLPSLFGWCWLITWLTNFHGLRGMGSPLGSWEPWVAGAIAILPMFVISWAYSSMTEY